MTRLASMLTSNPRPLLKNTVSSQLHHFSGSHPDQWRNIARYLNPGDDLSRSLSAEAPLNSDRWSRLKGLAFLWLPKEFWPLGPLSLGSVLATDPVVKVKAKVNVTSVTQSLSPLIEYFPRMSSFFFLLFFFY